MGSNQPEVRIVPARLSRRATLTALVGASLALSATRVLAAPSDNEIAVAFRALLGYDPAAFEAALATLEDHGKPDVAAALIMALRYASWPAGPVEALLAKLTGETGRSGWFDWMLWQEAHPEIAPHAVFAAFKREFLLGIDPNFSALLRPDYIEPARMRIRFEEIAWGGVRFDGIPALDYPTMIAADDAAYLDDADLVFGVEINGDARAYPLRIMDWHEMLNDVIGGVAISLPYCTLCGAGILFDAAVEGRDEPFTFGSSGFLYRSNKLMYDRGGYSLWNQFTGEPVVGPLVDSGIVLKQRPVTTTSWRDWRARHPQTRVLSPETGHIRDYTSGAAYGRYFSSPDLMFPAVSDGARLAPKTRVFGVRVAGRAKAWPLDAFAGGRVLNDRVGALPLVLIGEAEVRSIHAYERGARTFEPGPRPDVLISDGAEWRVTEAALIGPGGARALRVAGHLAFWFAWDSYLGARSELFAE